MAISQEIRDFAKLQNDAGQSVADAAEAEAGMAEKAISAEFQGRFVRFAVL